MLSTVAALLNAITKVSGLDGVPIDLTGIEELRFGAGTYVATVTGDGPTRIEVGTSPLGYMPPCAEVLQPEQPTANADASAIIAFAPTTGPVRITSISGWAGGPLVAHATNYRRIAFNDVGPLGLGGVVLGPFYNNTTQPSPAGTGNWTSAAIAFTWTPVGGYILAAGHALVASFGFVNAGVAFPGIFWRIT